MTDLEKRYGFAGQLAQLSDEQLVARFNAEVGNRGFGTARMYFLSALSSEIEGRDFDCSAVFEDGSLSLRHTVNLVDGRLVYEADDAVD